MKRKIIFSVLLSLILFTGCAKEEKNNEEIIDKKDNNVETKKDISIIDLESNTRPYAVVINNYPDATRVQAGLNEAYIVYEFPIEGGMTRSVALFKDKTDVKIGTVRSARHDYLDYALENDAIFVHFGWSAEASRQIPELGINNIDGNYADPIPFWRENPEGLATEHTVYTNLSKIIDYVKNNKGYRLTTDVKPSLNYVSDEINLNEYEDCKEANNVSLFYSYSYKLEFKYNKDTKKYDRYVNGNLHKDYFTKKTFDSKNVLITLINWGTVSGHGDAAGNSYLDLYNTGSGKGYYITNGYAREITWSKSDRNSKTVYKYLDGKEIEVNDGNTYIVFQSNDYNAEIS